MSRVIEQLVRYAVSCAQAFELDAPEILKKRGSGKSAPGDYAHENYRYAAGVYLALYSTRHPANTFHRNPKALERFISLADPWVTDWEKSMKTAHPIHYSEWPPFMILRGLQRVGIRLGAARVKRWKRFITHVVESSIPGPFFFTAPNHESWGLAITALAGRVLKRRDWTAAAVFKTRQLLQYQMPEGFWEEGRHHGPSMKYNSLMLAGLNVVARETGDREIRDAAARLSSFMARWSFPNGITVGAFDGRQSTSPGYFGVVVPGLELTPAGWTHLQRILAFWERAGWLDNPRQIGPSNWYTHFGLPFAGESLMHYSGLARVPRPVGLPLDRDGARLESHVTHFDGVLRRQGPWCVAVSGQMSDVPKDTQFIYRLERQSRLEISHDRAAVVLGGGHSLVTAAHPLFNVWIETGHGRLPGAGSYSNSGGKASGPEMALRRSRYYPRAVRSGATRKYTWLELVFAHGTVRFELEPAGHARRGDMLDIRYSYRLMDVLELRMAMPLVAWRTAQISVNGRTLTEEALRQPVAVRRRSIVVDTPLLDSRAELVLPAAGTSRVRWPLEPLRTYGQLFKKEHFSSFFRIALAETIIARPGHRGSGCWKLKVS